MLFIFQHFTNWNLKSLLNFDFGTFGRERTRHSPIFLVSLTEVYKIKNGKVSMYLNVDSFVYLPNFNQESNKTAYNDDSVSFIVHHIQENNDWLEHIEEYRTNRQAFQSLTTSPELDICRLYNSVIIIITQLHHRVKTISSRRSLLTGDKLNKVRRVRHTVMQCSTFRKKSWGQLAPKVSFFVTRTSILVAKHYI